MTEVTAEGLLNHAQSLIRSGALPLARRPLKQALLLDPANIQAGYNLGVLNARLGASQDAISAYLRSHYLDPSHAPTANNLADALLGQGFDKKAETICRTTLRLQPLSARLYNALALVNVRLDKHSHARKAFLRALALNPGYGQALSNLALLCFNDNAGQAETFYYRALTCAPPSSEIYGNLGALLQNGGRIEKAADIYRQGLDVMPDNIVLRSNLAAALLDMGSAQAARDEADNIISRVPNNPEALWVRTWTDLLRRDLKQGYQNYDLPWQNPGPDMPAHATTYPLWDGRPLKSGRLFLWCERGIGDEVLYAGLINDLLALEIDPVIECDRRLIPIFSRTWPTIDFIAKGSGLPAGIAAQSSLLRLPMFFRRDLRQFPTHQGYLKADPDQVDHYREVFAAQTDNLKVGISWKSGNPRTGFKKSTRLDIWEALLNNPSMNCVSLQYNQDGETHPRLADNPGPDIGQNLDALVAQIAALDHIISISGITAHLAGALGKPGHVLLPAAPVWFWFDRGADCPWYPSLRLMRGDHGAAINSIIGEFQLQ